MNKFLAIFILFLMNSAIAEYRVYQYIIKNKINTQRVGKPLITTSTLDPISFVAYNGGSKSVEIDLLRTWMCPGNTKKKDLCKSPYRELSAEKSDAKN